MLKSTSLLVTFLNAPVSIAAVLDPRVALGLGLTIANKPFRSWMSSSPPGMHLKRTNRIQYRVPHSHCQCQKVATSYPGCRNDSNSLLAPRGSDPIRPSREFAVFAFFLTGCWQHCHPTARPSGFWEGRFATTMIYAV